MPTFNPLSIAPWEKTFDIPPSFSTTDYSIFGKMVQAQYVIDRTSSLHTPIDEVQRIAKEKLIWNLVEFMLNKKLIEFTTQTVTSNDAYPFGATYLRARCLLTTDDQVRILRTHGIKG